LFDITYYDCESIWALLQRLLLDCHKPWLWHDDCLH
jgi:hypothetical protein